MAEGESGRDLLRSRIRRGLERKRREGTAAEERGGGDVGTALREPVRRDGEGIVPRGAGAAPLSFSQQRLWFLHRLDPASAAYNVARAFRLEGELDAGALAAALRRVEERHRVLRTTFREQGDGDAVQVVNPPAVQLERVDLAAAPDPEAEVEALRHREAARPFDLATAHPWRARLLELPRRRGRPVHVLLLTFHHVAFDGWSLGRFLGELEALYRQAAGGAAADLPELPVQYADYAHWQRRRLTPEVLEEKVGWWRRALDGAPEVLELPADHPRPPRPSLRGRVVARPLAAGLDAGVRAWGERGVTPFMVGLAVFAAQLGRWTGARDVVVGTPVAGRLRPEVEPLVGFFVNTLALRVDLSGEPGLGALLERLRQGVVAAYQQQEVPFELLVERLSPQRRLSHAPLFQHVFTVQETPAPLRLEGCTATRLPPGRVPGRFDLTLMLVPREEGLAAELVYAEDLFRRATAERFLASFETLLAAALAHPGTPLARLPLLTAGERHQVLVGWNDTAHPETGPDVPSLLLHEVVRHRAERDPAAPALRFRDEALTYGELVARAERGAQRLRRLGVGPEVPVALALDRCTGLVVSLLAVLRAGGAFLPVDPDYPEERIAFMLRDALGGDGAQGRVVVTRRDLVERLRPLAPEGTRFVTVDGDEPLDAAPDPGEPPVAAARPLPDSPAYVIYTSGTTGRPKGAVNRHRSILNRLLWMVRAFRLGPGDRVLHKAPFSFDVSVWEIFAPLVSGAELVLAEPGGQRDPAYLVRTLRDHGITTAQFVPSLLAVFLDEPGLEECTSLRRVVASGEASTPELVRRFHRRLGAAGVELYNVYGPTETAVGVTFRHLDDPEPERIPLGRPIDNVRVHVVDRHGQPQPPGVPGELLIGGVPLARGYLRRPALTAERFVPDPFAERIPADSPLRGDGRLYRTGDLARYLADGELEFLGRLDHQVKVSGLRIELGEVEAALASHPRVREAVAVTREDAGSVRLVGYLVADGEAPSIADLRRHLERRLPAHVVPADLVFLDALPLNPAGKVDRAALPAPEGAAAPGVRVAPRDPFEEQVVDLWAELLPGAGDVGIHDDFFERGGHSLLGIRMVARLRRVFGIELPLRWLFEAPTPAGLAARISEALGSAAPAAPLRPAPRDRDLPLSLAQERLWFVDRLEAREGASTTYNVPFAWDLEGSVPVPALAAAWRDLVARHEALRTRFGMAAAGAAPAGAAPEGDEAAGDRPVQRIAPPPRSFPLARVDLSALPAARREAELERVSRRVVELPFDLEAGPLLRAVLVSADGGRHRMVASFHHAAVDGWSLEVVGRELSAFYRAHRQGRRAELPELPVQYADWAVWQRRHLDGEALAEQETWWLEQLAEVPVLELPTDRPRPNRRRGRGAVRRFVFPAASAGAVERLASRLSATPFQVLMAAWQALLARYARQPRFAVGTPVAGRGRPELEGMVGYLVDTLALPADLTGRPSFAELVARVRETALAAWSHQEVPFDRLVAQLAPRRQLSHTPIFQVMMAWQGDGARLELPGVEARRVGMDAGACRCDLTLLVRRDGGGGDGDGDGPGLAGLVEYDVDLFRADTVDRLVEHLGVLLESAAAAPDGAVEALSLLTPAEEERVVRSFNRTAVDYPRDVAVHELVRQRAAERPEAVALVWLAPEEEGGDPLRGSLRELSYGELDAASDRLARRLLAAGVEPGETVALAARRSPELVVAILAILKAGALYLPLDPSYPDARLAFMLEDTGCRTLLAEDGAAVPGAPVEVSGGGGLRRLSLDRALEAAGEAEGGAGEPLPPVDAGSAAYVMYTSGSTGTPKGVQVTHRNVVRLVQGSDFAAMGPDGTWLLHAPVAFDASTLEIWGPLANGGRLALAPPGHLSLDDLGTTVERLGVTETWLTAGLFHHLVETNLGSLAGLRCILTGGDVVSPLHVRRVLERHPGISVVNGYGPTENTTFTTTAPLARRDTEGALPIGSPISNTTAYVVDRGLRPLPVGVPGELVAGGDGVAMGYRDRPALTAERFVPDPFGPPGSRLYRTGDLCRWRPDGRIDFLGRLDTQVKIRGFRIEPGEVEATLKGAPGVLLCAVVVREDVPGDKRLVAYVVPAAGDGRPTTASLRDWMGRRLADHMVPAHWVFLPELPLTPNAKVDRRALPAPEPERQGGYVAPRDPREVEIAALFAELLRVERVGVDDDFFALGGHSLLATRLVAGLRRRLGVALPLADVFETPTVAALAARVARQGGGEAEGPVPVGREQPLPASYGQERLWFLERLEPGTSAYQIPGALRLEGRPDAAALAAAFTALVDRHEALRTRFVEIEGRPYQEVVPAPRPFPLATVDLSALPPRRREGELERVVSAHHGATFDLAGGLLLRAALVRLGATDHALSWVTHHVASDGWSTGVLLRDLGELYDAWVEGREPRLPELPVGYPDHAAWQRRALEDGDGAGALAESLEYWHRRLEGAPEELGLPTDRPRSRTPAHRAGTLRRSLPPSLVRRVLALAGELGATPFMVLLAALDVVLSRHAGQPDVLVGSPIAGRERPEVQDLVGFFLNNLVLRLDLAGDPTFRQLVEQARAVTTGAYAHQQVPFERLLQDLRPGRDTSRTPFFQVMLNSVPPVAQQARFHGLACRTLERPARHSKFDLTLYADTLDREGPYRLGWVYDRDLFDEARVAHLAEQLEAVLEAATAEPERRLSELPLRTAGAAAVLPDPSRRLPAEWSGPVHGTFLRHAAEHPERLAVADPAERWTYGELAQRTAVLARRLGEAGVGRGDVVAIHGHRSAPLLQGLLAVLRSGAAFVVLDPAHPAPRRAAMVRRAGARVLLAVGAGGEVGTEVEAALAEGGGAPVVLPLEPRVLLAPEDLSPTAGEAAFALPAIPVDPDDRAYLAFTSGSTGDPKGITGTHGALGRYLPPLVEMLGLRTGEERVGLLAGLSHDPLHRDVFTPLQLGGAVVVPDPERVPEPGYLAAWMAEQGVTLAHLSPAMAQVLTEPVERGLGGLVPRLRRVVFYGDRVGHGDVERVVRLAPEVECWISYGSTESARALAYHRVTAAERASRRTLPLGPGGPDAQLLVLDRGGRQAGIGELGEVWVRGPNLGRDYAGEPAATADRWRPNPLAAEPGERICRTGDLGRYDAGGEVVFAGRADLQVKIRGFRVEPAEVERVLREHPGVRRAAVVPVRDDRRGICLVAWVVGERDPAVLRRHAAAGLPDYMVPAAFVPLDDLPRTPNGKLDRRRLPMPDLSPPEAEHELPRSPMEEVVVELFREVLGREVVGIRDDFFALGGHSLLATRIVSRLRQTSGAEVPLRALFEDPTPAGLALRVEDELRAAGGVVLPPVEPVDRSAPLPLSFSQERQWFLEQVDPGSPAYLIPTAIRVTGPLDPGVVRRALAEVVRRHEVLRTTFPRVDNEAVQRVADPASDLARRAAALPVADLAALPEAARRAEADRLRRRHARLVFDLARGPLVSALLVETGGTGAEAERLLLLTVHHIVTDGWSSGVLVRELATLCDAFSAGCPSPLPPLPIQYGDFTAWQRRWMAGEVLDGQLAYWRDRLEGVPVLELPTDRPRPPVQTHRGARVVHLLDAGETAALHGFARTRASTLFMVVLAAWQAVLGRLSGQRDFAVGTFIANRNRSEVEPLVGFFVNSLALRADLSGAPAFEDLLERVRETTLGAYAHQDLPFERLLQDLVPERDLSRSPIFQVMAVGLHSGSGLEGREGRFWETLPRESDRAAVDMTLWIYERGSTGTRLELDYNRDLFDDATAEATLGRVVRVLEAVLEAPATRLPALPFLDDPERARLAAASAGGAALDRVPVHRRFAEAAERRPGAVAVEAPAEGGGRSLAYGELRRASRALAGRLAARGVGPDRVVAVCLDREPELLVSFLGVLEAGGAYLPLDRTHPEERLAFLVRDAGARVLVTRRTVLEALPELAAVLAGGDGGAPCEVVFADAAEEGGEAAPENPAPENPVPADVAPENVAYVIYTSGSTGRPKGVMVTHGALSNFTAGSAAATGVGPGDRVLQFASPGFDASAEEIWPTLTRGATLVLRDDAMLASPGAFLRRCGEWGITLLDLPTAWWHQVAAALGAGEAELPATVTGCILGGEAARAERLEDWRRGGGGRVRLFNTYGPTEATVVATCWESGGAGAREPAAEPAAEPATGAATGAVAGPPRPVSIGGPVPGVTAHVLDRALEPVPVGVAGELCLGGAGLARGYLGRPGLTAGAFVPDPFAGEPGARLYRSGDLVRWRRRAGAAAEGGGGDLELEFLGRIDDQVKVRGFRIELGEVESVLARHPAVRGAAAGVVRDGSGAATLVGWVVPAAGEAAPDGWIDALRDDLRREVPDPLVPSLFVPLPALPTNASGKVDRKALPAPDAAAAPEAEYLPPETAAEDLLAEIWADVLGRERIGAGDDFFALGGHSLLATQVVTRIARELELELPVRQLFQTPVLRDLAVALEEALLAAEEGAGE